MKFEVVTPVYNAATTLPAVVAAWQATIPRFEAIVVIDDASSDASAKVAESAGVRVVRLPENAGRGAARARGMQETDAPLVVMCDATLVPVQEFITPALSWFAEPTVAAVFAHIIQPEPRTVADRWRGRHLFKSEPPLLNRRALLATSLCVLRRSAIEQVGGFAASLHSGEDADLGHRLLAGGWEVIADPTLRAMSLSHESPHALLARYARWNSPRGVRGRAWLRQLGYAVKTMAREDLRARDPLAAFLSLAVPFYQLRRR